MKELRLACIVILVNTLVIIFFFITPLEQRLEDCHFECNHLQTKLYRLQELNNYIPAMEQVLNPLQLAELKAVTEMIRQEQYQEYAGREMPLIGR